VALFVALYFENSRRPRQRSVTVNGRQATYLTTLPDEQSCDAGMRGVVVGSGRASGGGRALALPVGTRGSPLLSLQLGAEALFTCNIIWTGALGLGLWGLGCGACR
jgi:hypothetical protein